MNLIEQQNILKGMTDEVLQQEMAQPSGSVPPFLVLTEMNRRKSQRERYEGERARRAHETTVMDDVVGSASAPPLAMVPGMGSPAAMPAMNQQSSGAPTGIAAFAEGGMVGGIDYADLERRYADRLNSIPDRREKARALALLAAGLGIAGNGSPHFFTNVGRGALPAVDMYSQSLSDIDASESGLLRDALSLERGQDADELARMQFEWQQRNADMNRMLEEQRLNQPPAAARTTEWYLSQPPEVQQTYDQLNPPYSPNAVTDDLRRLQEANDVFQNALRSIPDPQGVFGTDQAAQVAVEKQKQAARMSYPAWVDLLGREKAAQFAKRYGLTDGDILMIETGEAPPESEEWTDRLDLGIAPPGT